MVELINRETRSCIVCYTFRSKENVPIYVVSTVRVHLAIARSGKLRGASYYSHFSQTFHLFFLPPRRTNILPLSQKYIFLTQTSYLTICII
jgi:hypothetical protein